MITPEDALVESFMLEKGRIVPMTPPWGGFAPGNHHWRGYIDDSGRTKWNWISGWGLHWTQKHFNSGSTDTTYRNTKGELHRTAGPAYISGMFDFELWLYEGLYHREDGPAIRHKNFKAWLRHGYLHRIGGPAIEDPAGPKQYWIDGHRYSPKEYKKECERRARKNIK